MLDTLSDECPCFTPVRESDDIYVKQMAFSIFLLQSATFYDKATLLYPTPSFLFLIVVDSNAR